MVRAGQVIELLIHTVDVHLLALGYEGGKGGAQVLNNEGRGVSRRDEKGMKIVISQKDTNIEIKRTPTPNEIYIGFNIRITN